MRISTLSETQNLITTIQRFKDQHQFLPGDFAGSKIWPTALVNGNQNTLIDGNTGGTTIYDSESLVAWQHLSLAQLIPGSYSGILGAGITLGVNTPPSQYKSTATYYLYGSTLSGRYPQMASLVLSGLQNDGWNNFQVDVKDAFTMDTKIDDGLPYQGKVITYGGSSNSCTTNLLNAGLPLASETYILSSIAKCIVHFAVEERI